MLLPLLSNADDPMWPGLPPDCWTAPRLVHIAHGDDPWQANTAIRRIVAAKPSQCVLSPNQGYCFGAEDGRPRGSVTVYAEQDTLIRIDFEPLFGLSDVRWINEKLLFLRPWWNRIAATDLIFDVERAQFITAESLIDGSIAYQQYRASCPLSGCACIPKRAPPDGAAQRP